MGDVYDRAGYRVGFVNAWSGVYDAVGDKVGSINIFTGKVHDSSGSYAGQADIHGNVYGPAGEFLCTVAFFGFDVKDSHGAKIGSVGIAGAPEPMPDMQWRGAAALLLLCREPAKPDLERVALRYLLDGSPAIRLELIRAGRETVIPLLHAFVKYLAAQGNEVKTDRKRQDIKAGQWSEKIMNPHVRPAMDVIAALGPPGVDGLFDGLRESDPWVQQAASVFLSISEHLTNKVVQEVCGLLRVGKVEHGTAIALLTFVLAQRGGPARAAGNSAILREEGRDAPKVSRHTHRYGGARTSRLGARNSIRL